MNENQEGSEKRIDDIFSQGDAKQAALTGDVAVARVEPAEIPAFSSYSLDFEGKRDLEHHVATRHEGGRHDRTLAGVLLGLLAFVTFTCLFVRGHEPAKIAQLRQRLSR